MLEFKTLPAEANLRREISESKLADDKLANLAQKAGGKKEENRRVTSQWRLKIRVMQFLVASATRIMSEIRSEAWKGAEQYHLS